MSDETTSEQLAEIEGQAEDTAATEYTPPEGWRVLQVGERLRDGDVTVCRDGSQYPADRLGGWVGSNQRYIRLIETEPIEPQPQPQPQPAQVREGRWRTRNGEIKNIRPCEPLKGAYYVWPWTDGFMTFQDNGRHQGSQESPNDLVEYLGPIEEQPKPQPEPQPEPQPQPQPQPQAAAIEELRSEVSYVQRLLGESQQRVAQLEELVSSLRTINEAQEKTVRLAGQANTDLQHRLDVVSAEWAEQSETVRKLRIELDAAQQVPQAVSDRFEEGWDAGTARAVETIAEWTEPLRTCGSQALATAVISNLPHIMRSLTGLNDEEIE